jgi:hypothetical protein
LNFEEKYVDAESVLTRLHPKPREAFKEVDLTCVGNLRILMIAVGGQGRHDEARELRDQGLEIVGR